jgi:high-affinity Fe2+/Pb2+ permease
LYISPVVPTPPKSKRLGLILGIIGGVLGAVLIGLGVYFLLKKCKGTASESDAMATVY